MEPKKTAKSKKPKKKDSILTHAPACIHTFMQESGGCNAGTNEYDVTYVCKKCEFRFAIEGLDHQTRYGLPARIAIQDS